MLLLCISRSGAGQQLTLYSQCVALKIRKRFVFLKIHLGIVFFLLQLYFALVNIPKSYIMNHSNQQHSLYLKKNCVGVLIQHFIHELAFMLFTHNINKITSIAYQSNRAENVRPQRDYQVGYNHAAINTSLILLLIFLKGSVISLA